MFRENNGQPTTTAAITRRLKAVSANLGMQRQITAYAFRHFCVQSLKAAGGTCCALQVTDRF